MANQKYGWAGFQRDISAPFVFKPLTDNMYDGIDVPKYFDGKVAQWGTRARPPQEFINNPTPFLGAYDRVSVSIAWTGGVHTGISNPGRARDKARPNPCVSDVMKLSEQQREDIRKKVPILYELIAARCAALVIEKAPLPSNIPPNAQSARPTAGGQGRPHAIGGGGGVPHSARTGGQGVAGHLGHQNQRDPHRNTRVVGSHPGEGRNIRHIIYRTAVLWAADGPPTPDNTKYLAGSLGRYQSVTALSVLWDDVLVLGYDLRPDLTFTPEVDSSPERNAFACLTLQSQCTGCVAIVIFKKRRGNVSTPLTTEERQSLNIGRTCAEVEACHRARTH
ncbi:hypothetical protein ONZ51_g1978 [Trametes cubensis]|uniref:Uncharacterized protein n=1 Tax=Trametes cubensis TaxID=1111947 RepID=A0AAD7XED6_9APHY|nr:hypothetical protein ONZ51_g1978 [Trametes cubensis]